MSASDRDFEQETIIRWDRSEDVAVLYTADAAEMRRWVKLGFAVEIYGTKRGSPQPRSWECRVPITAVALLALKAGQVHVPRWLEPPVIWEPAGKARAAREPETPAEILKEIDADFPAAAETGAGEG